MTDGSTTPESQNSMESSVEQPMNLIVRQPQKLEGLLETLALIDRVSEKVGEDHSGDLGSGGSGGTQGDDDDIQQSLRQKAIENLPEEKAMQRDLKKHLEKEVHALQKIISKSSLKSNKPGTAHQLNTLYARIRRLNGLLAEILEAGFDMVKRLYIRIFIDKQTVI
ncbi:MAG: hypothetical protein O2904_04165 [bacterium]|nr:hypothetical protein [bacterium]